MWYMGDLVLIQWYSRLVSKRGVHHLKSRSNPNPKFCWILRSILEFQNLSKYSNSLLEHVSKMAKSIS